MKRILSFLVFILFVAPTVQAGAGGVLLGINRTDYGADVNVSAQIITTIRYSFVFDPEMANPNPGEYVITLHVQELESTSPENTESNASARYTIQNPLEGTNTVRVINEPADWLYSDVFTRTETFEFHAAVAKAPDLVIAKKDKPIKPGKNTELVITNQGTADFNGLLEISYVSKSAKNPVLVRLGKKKIRVGKSIFQKVGLKKGTYTFTVDPNNIVKEKDETNNTAVISQF